MKAILKLHLTPVRMALITNTSDGKYWGRWNEPLSLASAAAVEVSTKVPQKTKNRTTMAQVITQGVDSENAKSQCLNFLLVCVCVCIYTCVYMRVSPRACLSVCRDSELAFSINLHFIYWFSVFY